MCSSVRLLFCVILASCSIAVNAAQEVIALGKLQMLTDPANGSSNEVKYEYSFDSDEQKGKLRIEPQGGNALIYEPEVGQEFFIAAYPIWFGNFGNLLCVQWNMGARNVGLTLFAINEEAEVREIFREGGVYGFDVLHLNKDDKPEIVIGDRDYKTGGDIVRVYAFESGRFLLKEILHCAFARVYQVQTE